MDKSNTTFWCFISILLITIWTMVVYVRGLNVGMIHTELRNQEYYSSGLKKGLEYIGVVDVMVYGNSCDMNDVEIIEEAMKAAEDY